MWCIEIRGDFYWVKTILRNKIKLYLILLVYAYDNSVEFKITEIIRNIFLITFDEF